VQLRCRETRNDPSRGSGADGYTSARTAKQVEASPQGPMAPDPRRPQPRKCYGSHLRRRYYDQIISRWGLRVRGAAPPSGTSRCSQLAIGSQANVCSGTPRAERQLPTTLGHPTSRSGQKPSFAAGPGQRPLLARTSSATTEIGWEAAIPLNCSSQPPKALS
jgi:hypothetical protein